MTVPCLKLKWPRDEALAAVAAFPVRHVAYECPACKHWHLRATGTRP